MCSPIKGDLSGALVSEAEAYLFVLPGASVRPRRVS